MTYQNQDTPKGPVSVCEFGENEAISNYSDFFDALMGAPTATVALEVHWVTEKFFDLKSGLAGEVLQKVSTYRKRLILIGDFSNVESKSLRDFIFESNRTGQVVFVPSLERGIELLRSQ